MGFKEWAKDKVFYSTHPDLIKQDYGWPIYENYFEPTNEYTVNYVKLDSSDWDWKNNLRQETRTEKQLEGWLYKDEYEKSFYGEDDPTIMILEVLREVRGSKPRKRGWFTFKLPSFKWKRKIMVVSNTTQNN